VPAAAGLVRAYAAARWGGRRLPPRVVRATLRELRSGLRASAGRDI